MFLYVYISIYIDTFNLKLPGCKNMEEKHIDKIVAVSSPDHRAGESKPRGVEAPPPPVPSPRKLTPARFHKSS